MGVHQRRGCRALSRRLFASVERAGGASSLRRRRAGARRGSAGGREDRQPIQDSHLSDLDGAQSRLWRLGARAFGQRRPRSQAHEPHHRGERAQRLRACRARRVLFRSLSLHPKAQAQSLDGLPRSRLGLAHRQFARTRRRRHDGAIPQSLRRALRHGGRAGERRAVAHRHGRVARRENLAAIQDRLRPVDRRHLLAVEFRHRHQDGILADAAAGRLLLRLRPCLQL